jgi:hypothetical protein
MLVGLSEGSFFVSSTEGCQLSLNGQTVLSQDGNTQLSELGIVAGDLLHVLIDAAQPNRFTSSN